MPVELRRFVQRALGASDDSVFSVDGVLALNEMGQIASARPAGSRIRALSTPRYPGRVRDHGGDCFAAIRQKDLVVHHPLRILRRGGEFPAAGGARSRRRRHQADALSHLGGLARSSRRWPKPPKPASRSRRWSSSRRASTRRPISAGRATSSAPACRSCSASSSSRRTPSCRWWCAARAARCLLCACRHRQLSPGDRAHLHRSVVLHLRSRDRAATSPASSTSSPAMRSPRARAHGGLAAVAEQAHPRISTRKARTPRPGEPAAIWMKMNSLVDPDIIDALYRAGAPACAIELMVRGICCLRPGVPGLSEISGSNPSSAAFSNTAASTVSAPGTACRTRRRGLHLLRRHDAAQSRPPRRGVCPILNPTVHEQVLDQIMVANLKDNEQSWRLLPTARRRASSRPRARSFKPPPIS